MNNYIYVTNYLRMNEFLNVEVKSNEDLLLDQDAKIKEFIKKYEKYLYSFDSNDIKEFYKLTGLFITHNLFMDNGWKNVINSITATQYRYFRRFFTCGRYATGF